MTEPRIAPLPEALWSTEALAALGHQRRRRGYLNIVKVLANHPRLAEKWISFADYILTESTLTWRDREIVILRIGWLCQSPYEWAQHVLAAKRAGLSADEIADLKSESSSASWAPHEAQLIVAANELHECANISDSTWRALKAHYTDQQMMDLVFTIGQYTLVSRALNAFAVPFDEGIEGFEQT